MTIYRAILLRFILIELNKKLNRDKSIKGAIAIKEEVLEETSRRDFRFLL